VKKEHQEVFIEKLKNGYLQRMNRRAEVYVCKASRGAYIEAIK
jgi:galactokinase